MSPDTIDYVLDHFSRCMTPREQAAWRHWSSLQKLGLESLDEAHASDKKIEIYLKKGWLSQDAEVLDLLQGGIDQFRRETAERIAREEEVDWNLCPQCGKLARTPKARQCRFCGHDWH